MTDTLCSACERPVSDQAYLCARCAHLLAVDLGEVPGLEPDLEITLTRQDRVGDSSGGSSKRAEEPLPFSVAASEAGYVLTNTLSTWARDVARERGVPGPQGAPASTVAAIWLLGHIEWLRHRPEVAEAYDEITSAVAMVRLVIDRHGSRLYAGPCNTRDDAGTLCEADLHTRPGSKLIRCRECGAEHDAQHRRDWLLASAEQQLLTATELSRALPELLGRELKVNTIRTWAGSGRIVPHGVTVEGWPLYKVGEVIALAFATPIRATVRRDQPKSA